MYSLFIGRCWSLLYISGERLNFDDEISQTAMLRLGLGLGLMLGLG